MGAGILIRVERASLERMDEAYAIVREYYEAVDVVVRDDAESFARDYFGEGSGVWVAREDGLAIGCIALRPLARFPKSGEVKRLYVKPEGRGCGTAARLLEALERYAFEAGYRVLYLDTKDDLVAAIRFYRRHGYEDCARYNENPQATIFMKKEFPRMSMREIDEEIAAHRREQASKKTKKPDRA